MFEDAGSLVGMALRLEAERVLAAAAIVTGSPQVTVATIKAIDGELDTVMRGLERRGVAFPGHVLGAKYGLSGGEYLLLQIALMPFHAPDLALQLDRLFAAGDDDPSAPRLSAGLRLLAPDRPDPAALRPALERMPLCANGLVQLVPLADGDAHVVPGQAVLELYGLGPA